MERPVPKNYAYILQNLSNRGMKRQLLSLLGHVNELPPISELPYQLYQQMELLEDKRFMWEFARVIASLYAVSRADAILAIVESFPDTKVFYETMEQSEETHHTVGNERGATGNTEPLEAGVAYGYDLMEGRERGRYVSTTSSYKKDRRVKKSAQIQDVSAQQASHLSAVNQQPKVINPYMELWRIRQEHIYADNILTIQYFKDIVFNGVKQFVGLYYPPIFTFCTDYELRLSVLPVYSDSFRQYVNAIRGSVEHGICQHAKLAEGQFQNKRLYLLCYDHWTLLSDSVNEGYLLFILSGEYRPVSTDSTSFSAPHFVNEKYNIWVVSTGSYGPVVCPDNFLHIYYTSSEIPNCVLKTVRLCELPVVAVITNRTVRKGEMLILDYSFWWYPYNALPSATRDDGLQLEISLTYVPSCCSYSSIYVPFVRDLFMSQILYKMYNDLVRMLEQCENSHIVTKNLNLKDIFDYQGLYYLYNGTRFVNEKAYFDHQRELASSILLSQLEDTTAANGTEVSLEQLTVQTPKYQTRKGEGINKNKYYLEEQFGILLYFVFDILNQDGVDNIYVNKQDVGVPVRVCDLLGWY